MRIVFGMQLDDSIWSKKEASVGEVRTGPNGLLNILETQLGTGMQSVQKAQRIDQYMERLKSIDQESIWYHESFLIDPWSTARQLLEWRDELVEAGWNGKAFTVGLKRLNFLAELERVNIPLSVGRAERLQKVTSLLAEKRPIHIELIILTEPLDILPPVWQRIFELLNNNGTDIKQLSMYRKKPQGTNLSLIQSAIGDNKASGDLAENEDSLLLLKANNEWEAAEHVALWLAANNKINNQVTIICGTNTDILDQALNRHGLPRIGNSTPSRCSEMQQILPLMLANSWEPVDIRLVVELLSLSVSVFPGWVCKILLKAIAKEPGIGGKAWESALVKIAEKQKEISEKNEDTKVKEKADRLIESIGSVLVNKRFDPAGGIPEDQLIERCQVIIERLKYQANDSFVFAEIISQAREIQNLAVGKKVVPRIMLERMLDTVVGAGYTHGNPEEAAPWHVVNHPGKVVDLSNEVLWWGFNAPSGSLRTYWSAEEREALTNAGVHIEKTKHFRAREAFAWQQALMNTGKRFIAIYIAQIRGEEAEHHPYWDMIWSIAGRMNADNCSEFVEKILFRECGNFQHTADWQFAGRQSLLKGVQKNKVFSETDCYTISNLSIDAIKSLSYSQMNTLIGCPFKWTLQYYAGLHTIESQSIPTENQMIGTFCHRIIEELYAETNYLDPEDAYGKAVELYDSLIMSMASELLLEGNAAEKMRNKTAITESVRQLVETINRLKLTVEKTEAFLEGNIKGIPYRGFADMLLKDSAGNIFVLDMKWSSSDKYRKKEVEEGASLQLAAYAWMLRKKDSLRQIHAGYFMLKQGQLLSDSSLLSDEAIKTPYNLEQIWDMGAASLCDVVDSFVTGEVKVQGLIERSKMKELELSEEKVREKIKEEYRSRGLLYQSPPCMFCDFNQLCGKQRGEL